MMLNLSATAIIEKNRLVSDSVWIVLLEISTDDGNICLASNNEDVEWDGRTWTAFPFIIDQIKQEKDELIEVPVRISNVTRLIEYYVEYYDGLVGENVTLRVVNSDFLDEPAELEENFVIVSTSIDANWCTFKLGSGFPLRQRFPRNRILKDYCPFPYGGVECGLNTKSGRCGKTLLSCAKHQNTTRFGGEPAMCIGGIYSDIKGLVTYKAIHANSTKPVIHTGDEPVQGDDTDSDADVDSESEGDS